MSKTIIQRKSDSEPMCAQDIILALQRQKGPTRYAKPYLIAQVSRSCKLFEVAPTSLIVNMPDIMRRFDTIDPVEKDITRQEVVQLRTDFARAAHVTGIVRNVMRTRRLLNPSWSVIWSKLADRRSRRALAAFIRHVNSLGADPTSIVDRSLDQFITGVRETTFREDWQGIHRQIAVSWNALRERHPELKLQPLTVPSYERKARMPYTDLPESFRRDLEKYLVWCSTTSPYDPTTRARALNHRSIARLRDHARLSARALIQSGRDPVSITSLGDIANPDALRQILTNLHAYFTAPRGLRKLANVLLQIAREWVKSEPAELQELAEIVRLTPHPKDLMTDRAAAILRRFEDDQLLARLLDAPSRLLDAAMIARRNRAIAMANTGVAIAVLTHVPGIWTGQLSRLKFDVHVLLRPLDDGPSKLLIPAVETGNGLVYTAELKPGVANLIHRYRTIVIPKLIGIQPTYLLVKADGAPRSRHSVQKLFRYYTKWLFGFAVPPVAFRHLLGQLILAERPEAYVIVRDALGHVTVRTSMARFRTMRKRMARSRYQRLLHAASKQPRRQPPQPLTTHRHRIPSACAPRKPKV